VKGAPPYRKSGFFNSKIVNPLMTALGLTPSLTVRGRASGRTYTMPVWPLEYQDRLYLVAPRGNTHWARNLRAVGEGKLRFGGRTIRFKATEIPASQNAPIVAAYVAQNGKRYGGFVAKEFEWMPDPADHPVFLVIESRTAKS
jgi:deazaflavin-dependent oxidoreductase (nitroreductase family)